MIARPTSVAGVLMAGAIVCAAVARPAQSLASAARCCATACPRGERMAPCPHDCCSSKQQDDHAIPVSPATAGGGQVPGASPGWDAPPVVRPTPAAVVHMTQSGDTGPPLFLRLLTLRR